MLFWYMIKYTPQTQIFRFSNYKIYWVKYLVLYGFKNNGCLKPGQII